MNTMVLTWPQFRCRKREGGGELHFFSYFYHHHFCTFYAFAERTSSMCWTIYDIIYSYICIILDWYFFLFLYMGSMDNKYLHFLCNGSVIRRWTNETSNQFISQVNGLVSCPERSQGQSIAHKAPAAWFCCLLLLRWKPQIFRYFLFDCLALILLVQVLLNAAVGKKTGTTVFQFCVLIAVPLWCTLMMLYYSGVNTR